MFGARDTLVLPILYNAWHALELSLKFAINKLHEFDVIKEATQKNHNIKLHWELLQESELGDEFLRESLKTLKPYVESLSRIDEDGQGFRYAEIAKGQQSLASLSVVNIKYVQASVIELRRTLMQMKDRISDLGQERATGSYTTKCSRRDLLEMSRMLPKKCDWHLPAFDAAKSKVKERFNLSSTDFSKAVKVIEANPEMRLVIGLTTPLAYLSDETVLFVVEQWARLHPVNKVDNLPRLITIAEIIKQTDFIDYTRIQKEVIAKLLEALTPDQIAEIEAIYYTGQQGWFCEFYKEKLALTQKKFLVSDNLQEPVSHLIMKTNFRQAMARAIHTLGRPDLADEILRFNPGVVAT